MKPLERQRQRAVQWAQLGAAAAHDARQRRERTLDAYKWRALAAEVLAEAIALEKELESRRCKLCDHLRAEAWGLGHPGWAERRCARCWSAEADALARQRHGLAAVPAAAVPPGRPATAPPRQAGAVAPASGASAGGGGGGAARGMPAAAAAAAPAASRSPAGGGDAAVLAAMRDRDAVRVARLMEARSVARHAARFLDEDTSRQLHNVYAPPPEQPRGSYYYHDAVLQQKQPGPHGQQQQHVKQQLQERRPEGAAWGGAGGARAGDARSVRVRFGVEVAAPAALRGQRSPAAAAAAAAGGDPLQGAAAGDAAAGGHAAGGRNAAGGQPPVREPPPRAPRPVAGYAPAPRPLPSAPRRLPSAEADMEATLAAMEERMVHARTQAERSEALCYAQQLRQALAELRLLDRKGRKAAALQRHALRRDTRDAEGVARVIREGRPEETPTRAALRHLAEKDRLPVNPPRWLSHIHPDRLDARRAADAVAWRPPSARVPAPQHTEGMASAGDWSEYRYDWDLAVVRSMPFDEYRAHVRAERAHQSACATAEAFTSVVSSVHAAAEGGVGGGEGAAAAVPRRRRRGAPDSGGDGSISLRAAG